MKKNLNKIISYATNQMGTSLTESNLNDYINGGSAKPTVWITKKQLKAIKAKLDVDVPKAKFFCRWGQRLKAFEEADLDPDITGGK